MDGSLRVHGHRGPGGRSPAPALLVCLLLFWGTRLAAQEIPAADALEEAWNLVEAGDYETAEFLLRSTLDALPGNPEAHAALGLSWARQRQYDRALELFRKARDLGSRYEDLDLEEARCLFFLGSPGEALPLLDRYLAKHPDGWEAWELSGLSRFQVLDYEGARTAFRRALDLDATHAPLYRLHLGMCAESLGRAEEAREEFRRTVEAAPETPYARQAEVRLAETPAARPVENVFRTRKPARPWSVHFGLEGSHDTNPLAIGQDALLPAGVDDDGKEKLLARGGASFLWWLSDETQCSLGVEVEKEWIDDLGDFDRDRLLTTASARHWLSDRVSVGAGLSFEHVRVDADRVLSSYAAWGSVSWAQAAWTQTTVQAGPGRRIYRLDDLAEAEDPDGDSIQVLLRQDVTIPGTPWWLWVGYQFVDSETEGRDYDADTHAVFLGASRSLLFDIRGTAGASFAFIDHDHGNSRAVPAFSRAREDEVWSGFLRLERRWGEHFLSYAQVSLTDAESNVGSFDHDRTVWSLGFEVRY